MQEDRRRHLNAVLGLLVAAAAVALVYRSVEAVAAFSATTLLFGFLHYLERNRIDALAQIRYELIEEFEAKHNDFERECSDQLADMAKKLEQQKTRVDGIAISRGMGR